jgi:hypothetical protein
MTPRSYSTPAGFKQALEQRLRAASTTGLGFARRRQLLVFDRWLARVAHTFGDAVVLKGGLVVELRVERARTTKDVDLRMTGTPDQLLARLQSAGRLDLGDFMAFEIRPDEEHPEIQNDGMQYGGLRFRTACKLAGKPYGDPFGVDVAFGDPMIAEPEVIVAEDVLAFAGIAPPSIRLYPIATHVAEKLHAYTMPRARPNTRVKDLPDIALLATVTPIDAHLLRAALEQTFGFRKTHALPSALPDPPAAWTAPYLAMAAGDELRWTTLEQVTTAARAFLDPVLAGEAERAWSPREWAWIAGR